MTWFTLEGGVYRIRVQPGGPSTEPAWNGNVGKPASRVVVSRGTFDLYDLAPLEMAPGVEVIERRSPYNPYIDLKAPYMTLEASTEDEARLIQFERLASFIIRFKDVYGWLLVPRQGLWTHKHPIVSQARTSDRAQEAFYDFQQREAARYDHAAIISKPLEAKAA